MERIKAIFIDKKTRCAVDPLLVLLEVFNDGTIYAYHFIDGEEVELDIKITQQS